MSSDDRVTVVIADDQPVVRSGLRMILSADDEIQVVGEASDGREAVDLLRRLRPDVVLMDIQMPVLDGIEATRELARASSATRVLILTTYGHDDYVFEALRAGAAGFLLKTDAPRVITDGVKTVAAGDSLLAPGVTRHIIESYLASRRRSADPPEIAALTQRERDVLRELARGLSNAEIGAALFISEGTVKIHVARILDKLALRDRVQAVVFAYQHNLAPADS